MEVLNKFLSGDIFTVIDRRIGYILVNLINLIIFNTFLTILYLVAVTSIRLIVGKVIQVHN